ncbi:interleukin-20 receptor subunit alpha [Betta splendens]|uniref:Interleukin-20 receptor subunit alpha n=1 Tax=Betta splendens TaxID=158456 RepID=A0A6P7LRT7_BETSP|nr:interleukin-20 receptor subunit alpha [Betta splendens]XP_040925461.1 interleukin-20 receptor subunit alpha [Betta splendens]
MWSALVVLCLWVVHSAASSSLPSPVNVVFSSVNLKNVLQWSPGSGTPDDTLFTVKYAIYGDSVKDSKGKQVYWREVRHCQRTPHTRCDLSDETWDLEQGYYAKVRAVGSTGGSSNWTRTVWRFDPLLDTSVGAPVLSVRIEDNNAIVTMRGPMRYQPNNRTPVVSMATVYPQMTYNLSVHNTYRDHTHHFLLDKSTYTYQMMDYNTKYCFSARASVADMPVHCHSSLRHCETTPTDPAIVQLQSVIVGIVVPSMCICAIVLICYFLCNYLLGKGHQSPYVLNPPSFHSSPLKINEDKIILITVAPLVVDPEKTVHTDRLDPLPTDSTGQSTESDDLLPDYGAVVVGNSCERKDERVEDGQVAGFNSHQAKPHLPVTSTSICMQTHTQGHTWSQLNSGLLNQIHMWREGRECQGLFMNKNPQPHNSLAMGNDLEGKDTDVKFEEDADKGSNGEKVPLLSSYAFQNMINRPVFDTEIPHSDASRLAVDSEEADHDFYGEEEGQVCINWDHETRRLVVPVEFNKQRGVEGDGESGDALRLENVFVRQSSEEAKEAEALRMMGAAGVPETPMDDFISRWKLVIPVDQ